MQCGFVMVGCAFVVLWCDFIIMCCFLSLCGALLSLFGVFLTFFFHYVVCFCLHVVCFWHMWCTCLLFATIKYHRMLKVQHGSYFLKYGLSCLTMKLVEERISLNNVAKRSKIGLKCFGLAETSDWWNCE